MRKTVNILLLSVPVAYLRYFTEPRRTNDYNGRWPNIINQRM